MIELEEAVPENHIVLIYSPHLDRIEWSPALKASHYRDGFICWIIYDTLNDKEVLLSEFEPLAWTEILPAERPFMVH